MAGQGLTGYSAVRVFSATKARDREELGAHITRWLRDKQPDVVDYAVRQSSDQEFHCVSVVLFYRA